MSRIGAKPISVPAGVTVSIGDRTVQVKGPKGALETPIPPGIRIRQENGTVVAAMESNGGNRAAWGLARALLANAVTGVSTGFTKELDIVGVGYRAKTVGREVEFALGYSHPVRVPLPKGIDVDIDKNTHITVRGFDKQLVGAVAARIRALRKPDPYKQKGVRYTGERLIKKAGKKTG